MRRAIALQMLSAAMMIVVAAGCTTNEAQFPKPLEYYIGNAQPLEGERLQAEYLSKFAFNCFYTAKGFIGKMELPNGKFIHLAGLESGEVIQSVVPRGRGPKESLVNPMIDLYGNNLYANDIVGEKVLRVNLGTDSLQVEEYFRHRFNKTDFAMNIQAVSDSLFVFFLGTRRGGMLALTDYTGEVLDSLAYPIVDDPELPGNIPVNFNVSMKLSPCGRWLFVQNYKFNNLRKYEIASSRIALSGTYNLTEPKYIIADGNYKVQNDNVIMNGELFVGEEYIYMPAIPETLGQYRVREKQAKRDGETMFAYPNSNSHLFVFDYNFNLIKSYVCDARFKWLALTPDPEIIYAADFWEHCLRKYTLTGLK